MKTNKNFETLVYLSEQIKYAYTENPDWHDEIERDIHTAICALSNWGYGHSIDETTAKDESMEL